VSTKILSCTKSANFSINWQKCRDSSSSYDNASKIYKKLVFFSGTVMAPQAEILVFAGKKGRHWMRSSVEADLIIKCYFSDF